MHSLLPAFGITLAATVVVALAFEVRNRVFGDD